MVSTDHACNYKDYIFDLVHVCQIGKVGEIYKKINSVMHAFVVW